MLEVHDGGPVVGLVLDEATGGAAGEVGEVEAWVHREVEAVRLTQPRLASSGPEGRMGGYLRILRPIKKGDKRLKVSMANPTFGVREA